MCWRVGRVEATLSGSELLCYVEERLASPLSY